MLDLRKLDEKTTSRTLTTKETPDVITINCFNGKLVRFSKK